MNEPSGISGPAFAWLYAGLVVVPMLVGMLITWSARRGSKAPSSKCLPTIYHLAYLVGGPDRVTDVVVAAMIEREQLRVSSAGGLHTTPNQPIDPLELEAMGHVANRSATTAFSLREPMRASAPMASLAAELAQQNLVFPDTRRRLVWRTVLWVYVVVFVLGIVRVASGADLGRPIGVLVFLIVLAVAGMAVAGLRTRPCRKGEATKAGRAAFEEARGDRSLVAGAAGIVTKRGLRRYPDFELAKALTKSHPPNPRNQRPGSFGYASGGYVGGIASLCSGGGGSSCAGGYGGSSCGGGGGCGGSSCGGGGGSSCGGGGGM
jgi:uncharacterized protein (TIGR04222 family)